MSRSVSPSARSTSSTSSTTTLRSLYGSLADEFDASTLDTVDFDVLCDPMHAFADSCYADVLAEPSVRLPSVTFSRASSPDSTASASPAGKRRSMWVHNGLGALDESFEDEESDEESHSTLDKIAPWADGSLRVNTRPESIIQFRRPSGASAIMDLEFSGPHRSQRISFMDLDVELASPAYASPTLAPLRPLQSLRFAPLPDIAPAPKTSKMKFGFAGLKKRL